jgi:hypothetical protein
MKNIILSLLLIVIGCTSSTDSNNTLSGPITANRIKSVQISNHTITFLVNCTIPEPCWEYARTDQAINGFEVNLKIFGKRATNDPCVQVLSSLDAKTTTVVPTSGRYIFHFWSTDDTSIDTTIVVQ